MLQYSLLILSCREYRQGAGGTLSAILIPTTSDDKY